MIAASCSSTRAGGPEAATAKATPPAMARSATALNSRRKRELPPNRGAGPCAGVRFRLKSGSRTARESGAASFIALTINGRTRLFVRLVSAAYSWVLLLPAGLLAAFGRCGTVRFSGVRCPPCVGIFRLSAASPSGPSGCVRTGSGFAPAAWRARSLSRRSFLAARAVLKASESWLSFIGTTLRRASSSRTSTSARVSSRSIVLATHPSHGQSGNVDTQLINYRITTRVMPATPTRSQGGRVYLGRDFVSIDLCVAERGGFRGGILIPPRLNPGRPRPPARGRGGRVYLGRDFVSIDVTRGRARGVPR